MSIPISVFHGGHTRVGEFGVEYSVPYPSFMIDGTENSTIRQIRNSIYRNLGASELEHSLAIFARWNVATTGYWFETIEVADEDRWQDVLQCALSSEHYRTIHLYVNLAAINRPPSVVQDFENLRMEESNEGKRLKMDNTSSDQDSWEQYPSTVPSSPRVPSSPTAQTGPIGSTYPPLLKLQASHRSQRVIEGSSLRPLFTRKHLVDLNWDTRYEDYVIRAGLYGVHRIGHIPIDHALISALAERWRQETHSFHFPVGEMTITLQDVAVLLGLRVDGDAICLRTDRNWSAVVRSLLGREIDAKTFRKKSRVAINMSWLYQHFSDCPRNADEITVQHFARAYCFFLVGSVLFTDHSGDSISAIYLPLFRDFDRAGRYSWASGVLAFLYKELCLATKPTRKQFAGSTLLLQLWSWERLPMGRPRSRRNVEPPQLGGEDLTRRPPLGYGWSGYHEFANYVTCRVLESYRREIDGLNEENVIWLPYVNKMDMLPPICGEDLALWRTTAPLIHFWIVEMYNPGRVARQFDIYQHIPPYLRDTNEDLHNTTNGRGAHWPRENAEYLLRWNLRWLFRLRDNTPYDQSNYEAYMRWFSNASTLYLSSPGGIPNTHSSAQRIRQIAMAIVERYIDITNEASRAFARDLLHQCRAAIQDLQAPINSDDIFAIFDGERAFNPVQNHDPGPSNPPAARRAGGSTSR